MRRCEQRRKRDRRRREDPDADGGTNCGRAADLYRSTASAYAASHHTSDRSTIYSASVAVSWRSSSSDDALMCLCPLPWSDRGERVLEVLSHRPWSASSCASGDAAGCRARSGLSHRVRTRPRGENPRKHRDCIFLTMNIQHGARCRSPTVTRKKYSGSEGVPKKKKLKPLSCTHKHGGAA